MRTPRHHTFRNRAGLLLTVAWALALLAPVRAQTWNQAGGGAWDSSGNWTPATVPNAVGAAATLGPAIAAPGQLELNVPVTLGTLTLNNANAYTVAAGTAGTLTFDVASGTAALTVNNTSGHGAHTISAPITLADRLIVTQNSSGTLTLSGGLAGGGANGVQIAGPGTTTLSGASSIAHLEQLAGGVLNIDAPITLTGPAIPAVAFRVRTYGTTNLNVADAFAGVDSTTLRLLSTLNLNVAGTLDSAVISPTGAGARTPVLTSNTLHYNASGAIKPGAAIYLGMGWYELHYGVTPSAADPAFRIEGQSAVSGSSAVLSGFSRVASVTNGSPGSDIQLDGNAIVAHEGFIPGGVNHTEGTIQNLGASPGVVLGIKGTVTGANVTVGGTGSPWNGFGGPRGTSSFGTLHGAETLTFAGSGSRYLSASSGGSILVLASLAAPSTVNLYTSLGGQTIVRGGDNSAFTPGNIWPSYGNIRFEYALNPNLVLPGNALINMYPAEFQVLNLPIRNNILARTNSNSSIRVYNGHSQLFGTMTIPAGQELRWFGSGGARTRVKLGDSANDITGSGRIHVNSQGADYELGGPGNDFAGTYDLYSGTLIVADDAQLGAASATVNFLTATTLRVTGTTATTRPVALGNNINATLQVDAGAALTFAGAASQVSGTGHLHKRGLGTLAFTGNATAPGVRSLNVTGTVRLDSTGTNVGDRVADTATVTMRQGHLALLGNAGAATHETLGALTAHDGHNVVQSSNGTGFAASLTFASLTRSTPGYPFSLPLASAHFTNGGSGDALGTAANRILFASAPTLSNGIIGAWATADGDFATYGGNGAAPLPAAGRPTLAAAAASDNAIVVGSESIGASKTVNTVKLTDGTGVTVSSGQTLTSSGYLLTGGTATITGAGNITSGPMHVQGAATSALTIDTRITGSSTLIKTGPGTLTLTNGTSAFTGGWFVVNEGTVSVPSVQWIAGQNYLGEANLFVDGGTLRVTGTGNQSTARWFYTGLGGATVDVVDPGTTVTMSNNVAGGGGRGTAALVKTGAGTLNLGNLAGGLVGDIVVRAGALTFNGNAQLGASANDVVLDGGTLRYTAAATESFFIEGSVTRKIYVRAGGGTLDVADASGTLNLDILDQIEGDGALTKAGAGTLNVRPSNRHFTGDFTIAAGRVNAFGLDSSYHGDPLGTGTVTLGAGSADAALYADNRLTLSNPLVVAAGAGARTLGTAGAQTVGMMTHTGTSTLSGAITLDKDLGVPVVAGTRLEFAGSVGGMGGVSKSGSGTLALLNDATYTGTTLIAEGTLEIAAGGTLSGSALIKVAAGAVLDTTAHPAGLTLGNGQTLAGGGMVSGRTVIGPGATVAPGGSVGTLSGTAQTWLGGGTFAFEVTDVAAGPGIGWDLLALDEDLLINATPGNPFRIVISSLLDDNATPGDVQNFDNEQDYSWLFVQTATGIAGFDGTAFLLDWSGFSNDLANTLGTGRFAVMELGDALYLNFIAGTPEPSSLLLLGLALLGLLNRRRGRQ